MRFTQESAAGVNLIRAYAAGEFRINDQVIRGGVIVSASDIVAAPDLRSLADFSSERMGFVLGLNPEVVLLGTGTQQRFPERSVGATFLRAGVGFEVMDTGAACRTFNVLVAEQRRVVAVLLT